MKYFLPVLFLFVLSCLPATAQYLVGYHQNWNDGNSPYIPLDQVDSRYTVVNLAFPLAQAGTDYDMYYTPCCGETQAGLIQKIQTLQANGVKVNISIGGATVPISLDNLTERNIFVSSMGNIINTYGLDGIDIDLEGSSLSVSPGSTIANPTDVPVVNMIAAIQQLMVNYQAMYGQKMFLSAAPETAFVQGGQGNWGGIWGAYLPLLEALRVDMDVLHVQLYNSGSMYGLDGNIYSQSTADFIVSQSEAVIQGFTAAGGAGNFTGFGGAKVSVGLPACPSAAGGGFTATATVKAAIDYLRGTGPKPGNYTLQAGPYPNLGGMMTWSINWDAVATCNATAYEYAGNYEDIFEPALCWQPNLGADVSACGITFPYTLNSGTTPNPNVLFTWKNLTTNQTLVSNAPGANTWNVSAAGNYQVQRDSFSCSKTDNITILNNLPVPNLPASENICAVVPISLMPGNVASFPSGTSFQWSKNNVAMPGETNSTLGNIRTAGSYKLAAQKGSCSSENTTTVTSDVPVPVDGCEAAGNPVALGITTGSAGPFSWFANSAGGTSLGTGVNFTTPILNTTTTYFVEDGSSVGSATTGPPPTGNGLGSLQNWAQPTEIVFDVANTFTLQEITLYPMIWCYTHTVSFEIRNAAGAVLPNGSQSFSIVSDTDCGNVSGPVTVTLTNGGVQIPAGTGYKLVQTGSIGLNHWQGTVSYPMVFSPYFTITGGNVAGKYMAVHDWKVAGGGCARLPVVAEISPNCTSIPVELSAFSARLQGGHVLLDWHTENEANNKGFHILRKTGSSPFENIGWTDAGQGPQNSYQFLDEDLQPYTTYYYQLSQQDWDGRASLSPIETVQTGGLETFQLFPNPAVDALHIRALNDGLEWPCLVRMFNAQGVLFLEEKMEGGEHVLQVGDFPKGLYWVKVGNGDGAALRVVIL